MAKPNYQFDKRQRELEKKKKQAEKANRKAQAAESPVASEPEAAPEPASEQSAQ